MKDDIRLQTRIIIKRGPEYLVGTIMGGPDLKWSTSPWEAWWTRDRKDAERVARAVDGELWLFNPVAAQIRPLEVKT